MIKLLFLILSILFGLFMIVFGEKDDSPGAQFLGLLIVIGCIIGVLKNRIKRF